MSNTQIHTETPTQPQTPSASPAPGSPLLARNNPAIDFDTLEAEIRERLAQYAAQGPQPPAFDAARAQAMAGKASAQSEGESTLAALYALEDEAFVQAAHRLLLGRPASAEELLQRVQALREGESKTRLVYQLRYSPEGRRQNEAIALPRERLIYGLMALPVLGPLVDWALNVLTLPGLRRLVQAKANQHARALADAARERRRLQQLLAAQHETLNKQAMQISALQRAVHELQAQGQAQEQAAQQQGTLVASAQQRLGRLEARLSTVAAGTAAAMPPTAAALPERRAVDDSGALPADTAAEMDEAFYMALEGRFRGEPEALRERLAHHLPRLQALALPAAQAGSLSLSLHNAALTRSVVDLGCGRGEWLALLAQAHIPALGVDSSALNVDGCTAQGLRAQQADALSWLKAQADDSLGAITAFHLIEHLPFALLQQLLGECLRCLVPGGVLLLETPNPENLLVASTSFHLDPTHQRPLPPALSEFMLAWHGFEAVEIERLHPVDSALMLKESTEVSLRVNHLLYAAQDYAVHARKSGA